MAEWLDGEITEKRQWNDRLFSLRFSAPIENFKAGQFVRVALEIDDEIIARPYSLVNSPDESVQEIFFNIVPEGPLTPRLARLDKGDKVKVADRLYGFMTVDAVPDARDLWLLATGTGIGPFLSILKSGDAWQKFHNVVLVYSVRTASELAYQETIASLLEQGNSHLSYIPLVTRESVAGAINKRITAAIESGELEQHAGIDINADDSQVMMCGNSDMITEVTRLLESRDMRKHLRREPGHITTEKYH
jgi:ferredoxin--NADP+ reductase